MTPVTQTIAHDLSLCPEQCESQPAGNCLQAAVAAMLDLQLDQVPHFVGVDQAGGLHWWTHWSRWCRARGLSLTAHQPWPGEFYLAAGPSARGHGLHHVCVYRDGELIWDPHPSRVGLPEVQRHWVMRPSLNGDDHDGDTNVLG